MQSVSNSGTNRTPQDKTSYAEFTNAFKDNFRRLTSDGRSPLFRVGMSRAKLSTAYLLAFPEASRRFHDCSSCKSFINRFGNLVVINRDGTVTSAMWNPDIIPEGTQDSVYLKRAFSVMKAMVEDTLKVDQQFYTKYQVWGNPVVDEWAHLHMTSLMTDCWMVHQDNPGKHIAARNENFKTVRHALAKWGIGVIRTAVSLLEQEALNSYTKFQEPANWLLDMSIAKKEMTTVKFNNFLKLSIASVPEGFCHPTSGMLGTLLEAIKDGQPLEQIKHDWNIRVAPERYQRPTEAPKEGTLVQAKKLVAELGLEPSFFRRYARVEELTYVWRPRVDEGELDSQSQTGSIFDDVRTRNDKKSANVESALSKLQEQPIRKMTWMKFHRDVLPEIDEIYVNVPGYSQAFCGYTAPVNSDAKPILLWDKDDRRNPIGGYMLVNPTSPGMWGLRAGLQPVYGLTYRVHQFHDMEEYRHFGQGVCVVFDADPSDEMQPGMCLFPECLRGELHGVRSVVEEFSRSRQLEGQRDRRAAGIQLGSDNQWGNIPLVIKSNGTVKRILIDRWE